jgi:hypothetical protein
MKTGAETPPLIIAGLEGLEPPTVGFGVRCSAILSYRPKPKLTGLFVSRSLVTPPAIFFIFDTPRMLALVFVHRIIAALALGTFQYDKISHD